MCQFCWEELGARVLPAELRGEPRSADFDAPWCQPMLLQEGVRDVPVTRTVVAPTRRCLDIEAAWRSGDAAAPAPYLPPHHPFGAWQTTQRRTDSTEADRTAACMLLWRYQEWANEAARRHIWRATPADAAMVLGAFPALWAAWLVLEDAPAAPGLLPLASALAIAAPVLTEETVELWLQRRAALLWCDQEGFGALLDHYRGGLRPFLAHYTALRRSVSLPERARLVALAEQHGETGLLDWAPA